MPVGFVGYIGFDPRDDALAHGRDLIPRGRKVVAARDCQPAAQAS